MKSLTYQSRSAPRGTRLLQRGAVAVEFAFVIIVILMMTAGIVEFGRAFWYYNALDKATRDAARYMSALPATDMTNSTEAAAAVLKAKDMVVSAVNGARVSPVFTTTYVNITCDSGACNGAKPNTVTVSISFPIRFGEWFPFVIGPLGGQYASFNLSPLTTMRYMN